MIAYRTTANYKDVMKLGFPEHTSRDIIRRAKQIAIERFNNCNLQKEAVNLRKSPFDNRRLGIAPTEIVEELIGLSLFNDEESERKNV